MTDIIQNEQNREAFKEMMKKTLPRNTYEKALRQEKLATKFREEVGAAFAVGFDWSWDYWRKEDWEQSIESALKRACEEVLKRACEDGWEDAFVKAKEVPILS